MAGKRVVGYLRVSTDRQAEEGLGLEVQEQAVRRWAKKNGHRMVGWYRDAGVSGSNGLESRRALPEALQIIKEGKADGLVVYRLDRLARDLVLQETLLRELTRIGGEVFTTVESEGGYLGDDPNDPTRTLIRQIIGALGQWERSMIALRFRMGRQRKGQSGYAYGAPPFGYSSEDGVLVKNADEQKVLKRIRTLRKEGRSVRAITEVLGAEGFKTKRGGRWHPTTVARLVQRLEGGRM